MVVLRSGQASNLKTALKQLIKGATCQSQAVEEDDMPSDQFKVGASGFGLYVFADGVVYRGPSYSITISRYSMITSSRTRSGKSLLRFRTVRLSMGVYYQILSRFSSRLPTHKYSMQSLHV